jgi:hypothetical protein
MSIGTSSVGELSIGERPIAVGAEVSIPAVGVTVTAETPAVASGGSAQVPAAAIVVAAPTPQLSVNISAPSAAITVSAATPNISANSVRVPASEIVVAAFAPRIAIGAAVHVSNTVQVTGTTGSIGDHSIGEFAIGGGELRGDDVFIQRPALIILQAAEPSVRAGKRIDVLTRNLAIAAVIPEIDARKRGVKIQAIAS